MEMVEMVDGRVKDLSELLSSLLFCSLTYGFIIVSFLCTNVAQYPSSLSFSSLALFKYSIAIIPSLDYCISVPCNGRLSVAVSLFPFLLFFTLALVTISVQ